MVFGGNALVSELVASGIVASREALQRFAAATFSHHQRAGDPEHCLGVWQWPDRLERGALCFLHVQA